MSKAESLFVKLAVTYLSRQERLDPLGLTTPDSDDYLRKTFGDRFVSDRNKVLADSRLSKKDKRREVMKALARVYVDEKESPKFFAKISEVNRRVK